VFPAGVISAAKASPPTPAERPCRLCHKPHRAQGPRFNLIGPGAWARLTDPMARNSPMPFQQNSATVCRPFSSTSLRPFHGKRAFVTALFATKRTAQCKGREKSCAAQQSKVPRFRRIIKVARNFPGRLPRNRSAPATCGSLFLAQGSIARQAARTAARFR